MGGRRGLVGVVSFESGQGKDAVKKDNSRVEVLETEIERERKNSRARERGRGGHGQCVCIRVPRGIRVGTFSLAHLCNEGRWI